MPKRIDALTPAQEDRFDELVERWTAIGLCTEPADRSRAEKAIRTAYRLGGLDPPQRIVWCGSPFGQGLTRALIMRQGASFGESVKNSVVRDSVADSVWASVRDSVRTAIRDSFWDSVWDSVAASVWNSVWASVEESVGASVRASVWTSVWNSVGDSIAASVGPSTWNSVLNSVGDSVGASVGSSAWDSVRIAIRDSFTDSVWDSVAASVWNSVWDSVYGQHDAPWLAFYSFFGEVCGLRQETAELAGLLDASQSAGWWLPHERICWVSERHNVCSLDERGLIHAANGPAIAYPDGWAIWAWHGVRVPQQVIEAPETLTAQEILHEPNVAVRRVMIERFGPARLLAEANAERISHDDYGELYRLPLVDDEPIVMVRLVCPSTGHVYFERVPPDMERPRQALAWRARVSESEYILAGES